MTSAARRRREPSTADYDRSVGLLVLKVGHYPLQQGGLGAVRSLGRVGVPAYAVVEDAFTPLARSRYLTARFVAPTDGSENDERLLEIFSDVVARIDEPVVTVATDDESAVFLAEHAHELGAHVVVPAVPPELPRTVASKRGLHDLCTAHGFPTPRSAFPTSHAELEEFVVSARFPLVAKNVAPFSRLRNPAVGGTTRIDTAEELLARAAAWSEPFSVLLQEYIPASDAEDWIFHGYFDTRGECPVAFTGRKHRSWPPGGGVTTYAEVVDNDELATAAIELCRAIGYRGIADFDVRLDRRDGRYNLVDFNPRPGAQFRMFVTDARIDCLRAMHLDLTGRAIPTGRQVVGRRFTVEHLDVAALAHRLVSSGRNASPRSDGEIERAFWARDDVVPFALMAARAPSLYLARVARTAGRVRERITRRRDRPRR